MYLENNYLSKKLDYLKIYTSII